MLDENMEIIQSRSYQIASGKRNNATIVLSLILCVLFVSLLFLAATYGKPRPIERAVAEVFVPTLTSTPTWISPNGTATNTPTNTPTITPTRDPNATVPSSSAAMMAIAAMNMPVPTNTPDPMQPYRPPCNEVREGLCRAVRTATASPTPTSTPTGTLSPTATRTPTIVPTKHPTKTATPYPICTDDLYRMYFDTAPICYKMPETSGPIDS